MSTIRFGAACDALLSDGTPCPVYFNDYSVGSIVYCPVCERDLCPLCAKATGHEQVKDWDVDTRAELTCDPDELALLPDFYIDSPTDRWSMKEA